MRLDDHRWIELSEALRARLTELADRTFEIRDHLELSPAAVPAIRELAADGATVEAPPLWQLMTERLAVASRLRPKPPASLVATLRSYQVEGHAWLTREALPALRAARGSVVNIASTHAANPRAGMGQYDATKAAIVSLTKTLAFEEAAHDVRVNAVCPGATLTPFHINRFAAQGRTREELESEAFPGCLLGRWADPREIAYPILWLASEATTRKFHLAFLAAMASRLENAEGALAEMMATKNVTLF